MKDLNSSTFEVVADDFPVRTHVEVNPYYLQLATYVLAKPARAIAKTRVQELLCHMNFKAKLVKFTMQADGPDKQTAAWPILASVKLITGVIGGNYHASALKNMFLLFLHDLAELMADPPANFEMHPMMDIERLMDA